MNRYYSNKLANHQIQCHGTPFNGHPLTVGIYNKIDNSERLEHISIDFNTLKTH